MKQRIAELEEGGKLLVADILSRISKIAELEAERDVAETQLSAATHQLKELAQCRAERDELQVQVERWRQSYGRQTP